MKLVILLPLSIGLIWGQVPPSDLDGLDGIRLGMTAGDLGRLGLSKLSKEITTRDGKAVLFRPKSIAGLEFRVAPVQRGIDGTVASIMIEPTEPATERHFYALREFLTASLGKPYRTRNAENVTELSWEFDKARVSSIWMPSIQLVNGMIRSPIELSEIDGVDQRTFGPTRAPFALTPIALIFHEVTLWAKDQNGIVKPRISSVIENVSGGTRRNVDFTVNVYCASETFELKAHALMISSAGNGRLSFPTTGTATPCAAGAIKIRVDNLGPNYTELESDESAANSVKAAEAADRRAAGQVKVEADQAKARAIIAALPVLNNGREKVFVGSDLGCAQDIKKAIDLGGLEGRKKLAELSTFNCGFTDDPGTKVKPGKAQAGFTQIEIIDGENSGKQGWVATGWLKYQK